MSCYHPLKRFSWYNDDGSLDYKVTALGVDHLEIVNGRVTICDDDYVSRYASRVIRDSVIIGCGQCIGCRLDYSRDWANRCMLELGYHKSSYFLTLTYDDFHVPCNPDTGWLTLVPSDLTNFVKRLRANYYYRFPDRQPVYDDEGRLLSGEPLRFFGCGEYGSNTARPHYHLILFGYRPDPSELIPYKRNFEGDQMWNSPMIDQAWQYKGYCVLASVTWESCAYVARYVLKKQKGEGATVYEEFEIEPEFTRMSRDPGIAKQYFLDHPGCMNKAYINISTPTGGKKFKPPKYFERLYDDIEPLKAAARSAKAQEQAQIMTAAKLKRTDLDYFELLQAEEDNKLASIKALTRKLL